LGLFWLRRSAATIRPIAAFPAADDDTTRTIIAKGAPRRKEGTRVSWDGRELAPSNS